MAGVAWEAAGAALLILAVVAAHKATAAIQASTPLPLVPGVELGPSGFIFTVPQVG